MVESPGVTNDAKLYTGPREAEQCHELSNVALECIAFVRSDQDMDWNTFVEGLRVGTWDQFTEMGGTPAGAKTRWDRMHRET